MKEEWVAISTVGGCARLVEIREPGSTRFNDKGKMVAVRKIECSVADAEELYRQLGEKIQEEKESE